MTARIAVLGAGGMGSAYAAFLARSGQDVVLVGRGSDHVRRVARHGMHVRPPDASPWSVDVPVAVHAGDLPRGSVDVILLLTKAFDVATATRSAAPALAPDGVAVSLQNGLGIDRLVSGVVGPERALVGTTTVGATLQEPGAISVSRATAAGTSMTFVGAMGTARADRRADEVASALSRAGIPTENTPLIEKRVWEKLALAVMSPISSVLRRTVAQVWAAPPSRALVHRMHDEVVAVAAADGVQIDGAASWEHASRVFEGTGEHYTSMCTDVMKGRRTEAAAMSGAVRRVAIERRVPVPVHDVVDDLLATLAER